MDHFDMNTILAVYAWVKANGAEVIVSLLAISGALTHLSALTPFEVDDKFAAGFGRLVNVLSGFYGKNVPAEKPADQQP